MKRHDKQFLKLENFVSKFMASLVLWVPEFITIWGSILRWKKIKVKLTNVSGEVGWLTVKCLEFTTQQHKSLEVFSLMIIEMWHRSWKILCPSLSMSQLRKIASTQNESSFSTKWLNETTNNLKCKRYPSLQNILFQFCMVFRFCKNCLVVNLFDTYNCQTILFIFEFLLFLAGAHTKSNLSMSMVTTNWSFIFLKRNQ